MKTLRLKFKYRLLGQYFPNITTELVDVESDSTEEEITQQINVAYNNFIKYIGNNVVEIYPFEIL